MIISLEERVYGLSLLWKEAAYNFAYWDERPNLDWNKAYNEFLPKVIADDNPYSYYRELQRFIALLRDGHSYVVIPDELCPEYIAPISTSYIDGKHILHEVPKGYEALLYSEILSINGVPLSKYLDKYVFPYVWHEKIDSTFYRGSLLGYYINCREQDAVTINTVDGDLFYTHGEIVETIQGNHLYQLKHEEFKTMRNIVSVNDDVLYIDITTDNIAYIIVSTFQESKLKDELYKNIDLYKNCAGFLIDVRWNGGGSSHNSDALAQLFFKGKFNGGFSDSPMYIADYAAYGQYRNIDKLNLSDPWEKKIYDVNKRKLFNRETDETQIKDCPVYLSQPVVILSGCNTASAAESFLTAMKSSNRATIVGTASYGSNGQPFMGSLPGGGRFGICTHKCYGVEGVIYNNVGIQPDIFVENTLDNHKNRYDAMFDKGLAVLREMI